MNLYQENKAQKCNHYPLQWRSGR